MSELAGRRNGFVQVLVRSVLADGYELGLVVGNVQVQNGAAIGRPEGGADGAIRRSPEAAVLLAIEVDQPQRFVALAIENLRAARPGHRMFRRKLGLDNGGWRAGRHGDAPQTAGLVA